MKFEMVVGENERKAVSALMSTGKKGKQVRVVLFTVLAVTSFAVATIQMQKDDVNAVSTSILFGVSALFIWLLIKACLNKKQGTTKESVKGKTVKVTYEFAEDLFTSTSNGKKTEIGWEHLRKWGYFKNFLYIEFTGKQFVLLEREQLKLKSIESLENFLSDKAKRKDIVSS